MGARCRRPQRSSPAYVDACARRRVISAAAAEAEKAGGVVSLAWVAWTTYCVDYKKDADADEKLAKVQKEMEEMMKKNKDKATSVLDRMNAATETGIIELAFTGWQTDVREEKAQRELKKVMGEQEGKLKSLKSRMSGNAKASQMRVNEQMSALLLTRVICVWQIEARNHHIDKYYNSKIDSKRKQLHSVQTLFQSFAKQLDEGLAGVENDKSARDTGRRPSSRGTGRQGLVKDQGSVSLPDIHHRGIKA